MSRMLTVLGTSVLVAWMSCAAASTLQPIDLLRDHVARGIEILKDPRFQGPGGRLEQRERLCGLAREIFEPTLFARLVLAAGWRRFSPAQQQDFVQTFTTFLCRYYLSQLQRKYSNEQVTFTRQRFQSESRATVEANVVWRNVDVPVEIRMVRRGGQWKAYDIAVAGISAVILFRTQFQTLLENETPAEIIAALKDKLRANETADDAPAAPGLGAWRKAPPAQAP